MKRKKIVYFSPIDFDDLKQRPQYLVEGLSDKYDVVFVEPTKSYLAATLCGNKQISYSKEKRINDNLLVVKCGGTLIPPFMLRRFDYFNIAERIEKKHLDKYINDAEYFIVGFEGWANFVFQYKSIKVIYDKLDDTEKLLRDKNSAYFVKKGKKRLERESNSYIITSKKFMNELVTYNKPILYLPNGVSNNITDACEDLKKYDDTSERVYGYVGTISEWFDFEAIKTIAEKSKTKVVLVGPIIGTAPTFENVEYVGRVSKEKAMEYIQSFDVCLYPFKKNELLDTINPVKVYEYLSMNKPVIAIDTPEMDVFNSKVLRYSNYEELQELCSKHLDCPFKDKKELQEFINDNSWNNRVNRLVDFLGGNIK